MTRKIRVTTSLAGAALLALAGHAHATVYVNNQAA